MGLDLVSKVGRHDLSVTVTPVALIHNEVMEDMSYHVQHVLDVESRMNWMLDCSPPSHVVIRCVVGSSARLFYFYVEEMDYMSPLLAPDTVSGKFRIARMRRG